MKVVIQPKRTLILHLEWESQFFCKRVGDHPLAYLMSFWYVQDSRTAFFNTILLASVSCMYVIMYKAVGDAQIVIGTIKNGIYGN